MESDKPQLTSPEVTGESKIKSTIDVKAWNFLIYSKNLENGRKQSNFLDNYQFGTSRSTTIKYKLVNYQIKLICREFSFV